MTARTSGRGRLRTSPRARTYACRAVRAGPVGQRLVAERPLALPLRGRVRPLGCSAVTRASAARGDSSSRSRSTPSANVWRRNDSLAVFSSRRRIRYAMPGSSRPCGQYSRTRPASSAAPCGTARPCRRAPGTRSGRPAPPARAPVSITADMVRTLCEAQAKWQMSWFRRMRSAIRSYAASVSALTV